MVIAVVVLEDVLDVVRSARQVAMVGADLHVDEIAVAIGGVEVDAERILPEIREHPEDWIAARPRRGRVHRGINLFRSA